MVQLYKVGKSLLSGILIAHLFIGQVWAEGTVSEADAAATSVAAAKEGTQEAYDDTMSSTDLASATPTSFDQTEISSAVTSVSGVASWIVIMGSALGGTILLCACPAAFGIGYGSAAVFSIAGAAQLIAETINYIRFYDALQKRITAYQEKIVVTAGADNTNQLDAVKEAQKIHKEVKAALDWSQAIMSVANVAYGVAAILATVEAVTYNAGMAAFYTTAEFAALISKDAGIMGGCDGVVEAVGYLDDKSLHSPWKNNNWYEQFKVAQQLTQGSSNPLNDLYSISEWNRFLSGETQSSSIKHFEQFSAAYHSQKFPEINFRQFLSNASNIVFPMAMAGTSTTETMPDESAVSGDKASAGTIAMDLVMKGVTFGGAFLLVLGMSKTIVPFMVEANSRAVIFWVITAAAVAANVFIGIERDKVAKRIKEYDDIIGKIEKMGTGSTNFSGTTASTLGRTTAPTAETEKVISATGCVSGSYTSDPNCTCSASNSCAKSDLISGANQEWGFSMPSWGNSSMQSSSGMVDSIGSGNYAAGQGLAGGAGKLAVNLNRARKLAEEQLSKASNGKFILSHEMGDMSNHLAAVLKKSGDLNNTQVLGLGNLLPEEKGKADGSQAKALMASLGNNLKAKKATEKAAGFDWGAGFKLGKDKKKSEPQVPTQSSDSALNDYEVDAKDIHRDDVNIFDVVHSRYVQSYEKLFKQRQMIPQSPEVPHEAQP